MYSMHLKKSLALFNNWPHFNIHCKIFCYIFKLIYMLLVHFYAPAAMNSSMQVVPRMFQIFQLCNAEHTTSYACKICTI